ncbi:MAG: hypothetical protein ACP5OA_05710 [Candidatus Woesearchaeota archaeon]
MMNFLAHNSTKSDPMAMLIGVLCVLFSGLFFLQRLKILNLSFEVLDGTYLYVFAGLTLLSGITLLLVSLGLVGVR